MSKRLSLFEFLTKSGDIRTCYRCGSGEHVKPLGPHAEPICYTCYMRPENNTIGMNLDAVPKG